MHTFTRRGQLRHLIHSCLVASMAFPALVQAQAQTAADPEVEEVVVTGSYIRNSAFAQNSPVATINQDELYQSGAPSMANYIRDLSFTQNTNVVLNVLGGNDGAQSSTGTTFNLRGLGENSTLSMVDGLRAIDTSVTAMIPDIAIARVEIVLDGGSALYGSDAVAGVVNMIPIKQFDGVRARAYYQTPEEGGMEEGNLAILWGKSFDNGINYVGAFDARKRTRLGYYERPREWEMADGSSGSGNPGTYRRRNWAGCTVDVHWVATCQTRVVEPSIRGWKIGPNEAPSPAGSSLALATTEHAGTTTHIPTPMRQG